jgi:tetratricopeptide (TPR) repeat protein
MIEASDTLRTGIAIQAMRSSLRVFTREEHAVQWSTATLNLANALVYAPAVKQGDNLVEAVELYEEVLEARDRDSDPMGRARVLANQGNALAHLGIFDQAKAKLYEARFLFEEHLDSDSALMVRSVLDEIAKQMVPEPDARAEGRLAMGGIDPATWTANGKPEGGD